MSSTWPGDEASEKAPTSASADGGPIVPPDEWMMPAPDNAGGGFGSATTSPHTRAPEPVPHIDGLAFTRGAEQNSRAIIAMVLSGLAGLSILAFTFGARSPLLLTVGLGLAGIVMGALGRQAARNGLATNGGLGLAAMIVGALAVLAVVGIYALVLVALSRVIP